MNLSYEFLQQILKGYLRLFSLQYVVSGEYPLPAGPKIIAANHPNATDSFYLPFLLPEDLHFLMQKSIFSNPIVGWALRQAGQIEVRHEDGREAFKAACGLLRRGESIVIYPEGRLNPDHKNYQGRSGAVRMSLETGAPIIPLGIHVPTSNLRDIRRVQEPWTNAWRWQVSGSCYLKFGDPWRPAETAAQGTSVSARVLTNQLMHTLYGLVAQITTAQEARASQTWPNMVLQQ